jgi:transitional endoplasmic reticulum ATPase
VPVPDRDARLRILGIHTGGMPLADDVSLETLADRSHGYTGADLEDLVRRAGMIALREDLEVERVPMRLFEQALKEGRPSVTPEMEKEYEELSESLKRESPRTGRIGFHAATAPA